MEFSDILRAAGPIALSPNGQLLAVCVDNQLNIRHVDSLQTEHMRVCKETIQHVEFAADSVHILCAMFNHSLVQAFSLVDPDWTCQITEGAAGLESVKWAPDSRHIITTTDFQLRATVWSLINRQTYVIKSPKPQGIAFSNSGSMMATLERRDCKDFVNVYTTNNWDLVKRFPLDTKDAAGISWAPNDHAICVHDANVEYAVCLHEPDGRLLTNYSAYEGALGVKTVAWSTSGQLLAIGSYDGCVRLLNNITWTKVAELTHTLSVPSKSVVIYKEVDKKRGDSTPTGSGVAEGQYEVIRERPHSIPTVTPDPDKPNPKLGVGIALFSADGKYLATRNDNMPHCVWIWDMATLHLAYLLQQAAAVKSVAWHPRRSVLAVTTGSRRAFFWTKAGTSCVDIPTSDTFSANSVAWTAMGDCLLRDAKDKFCICYTLDALNSA
eukprot:m.10687 g.10687  ORF g.10687 m.10687 type:complete len:438 (-) comp5286_c0_seq1:359-1672(-)